MTMTARERFIRTLNFQPVDRLPIIEWAPWWDLTYKRWQNEGLPAGMDNEQSQRYFDLDVMLCEAASVIGRDCPRLPDGSIIRDEADYETVLPFLYRQEAIDDLRVRLQKLRPIHAAGDIVLRQWFDGFFWFARTLLGIERHLLAFYDQPELIMRINSDLSDFHIRTIEMCWNITIPDFAGFAEDMSYNLGPMLSEECFDIFLLPYYHKTVDIIRRYSTKVLVDSDGDITMMIPWFERAGIDGVYPLERQAGVDIRRIRELHPKFLMLGGYDKMVMPMGESAMREEFERLLPVMASGGFVSSVDHQTPPGVSLDQYLIYLRLFNEYAGRAATY